MYMAEWEISLCWCFFQSPYSICHYCLPWKFISNFTSYIAVELSGRNRDLDGEKTKHLFAIPFLANRKNLLRQPEELLFCCCVCVYSVSDRWTFAKTTKISLCALANRYDGLAMQYYTQKYTHNHSQGNVAGWDSVFCVCENICESGLFACICFFSCAHSVQETCVEIFCVSALLPSIASHPTISTMNKMDAVFTRRSPSVS